MSCELGRSAIRQMSNHQRISSFEQSNMWILKLKLNFLWKAKHFVELPHMSICICSDSRRTFLYKNKHKDELLCRSILALPLTVGSSSVKILPWKLMSWSLQFHSLINTQISLSYKLPPFIIINASLIPWLLSADIQLCRRKTEDERICLRTPTITASTLRWFQRPCT